MNEMVERVAGALFNADWPKAKVTWEIHFADRGVVFERYTRLSRAAIAAMRLPTEKMIVHSKPVRKNTGAGFGVRVYTAMIDGALKED